ncbi:MAG: hypothetical protein WCP79_01385 [Bacillota bacterium]
MDGDSIIIAQCKEHY